MVPLYSLLITKMIIYFFTMIIYFYVKMIIEVFKAGHSLPCQALCLSAPWPLCLAPWSSTLEFSHVVLFENHTDSRPVSHYLFHCQEIMAYSDGTFMCKYRPWGMKYEGDYESVTMLIDTSPGQMG
jgi:hypothetical protein